MNSRTPLLRLLRAFPGKPEEVRSALYGEDLQVLVAQGAAHGLAGLVHYALRTSGIALPESVRAESQRATQHQAAAGMRVHRLLRSSVRVLEQAGIRPILLKGYGLATRLYPEPFARATTDVDLLILPREVVAAQSALRSLGLVPKLEADAYYPEPYRHHLTLHGPAGLVELHFRPITAFGVAWEGEELIRRAVAARLEDMEVRNLCLEDELLYLALHAANHMFQRIAWLYDLKLLIRKHPELDWPQFVNTARSTGLPAVTYTALELARRVVGAASPENVLRALRPSWLRRVLSHAVMSDQLLVSSYLNAHKPAWALSKLLLADRRADVLVFSLRRLQWGFKKRVQEGWPGWARS